MSEFTALAGDALLRADRSADALEFIAAGEEVQHESEERVCRAELVRLRGRLFEIEGDTSFAQERYLQALAVAEQNGAKLFSLRAATDLAGLCNRTGRAPEGRTVLEPVYGWFSEGFGYPDLVRAKSVLEASTR